MTNQNKIELQEDHLKKTIGLGDAFGILKGISRLVHAILKEIHYECL